MEISWQYLPHKKIIIVVWHGPIIFESWRKHSLRLTASPEYQEAEIILSDLSSAQIITSFNQQQMQEIIGVFFDRRATRLKLAVIASEHFELARRFENLIDNQRMTMVVFSSYVTAATWAGIDLAALMQTIQEVRNNMTPHDANPT